MAKGKGKGRTAKVTPGNKTGVVAGGPGKSVAAKPIAGPGVKGGRK